MKLLKKGLLMLVALLVITSCCTQEVNDAEEIPVELGALVELVKTALLEAQTTQFAPRGLKISKAKLSLTVKEKMEAEGEVSFVMVTIGAGGSNETMHTFEVTIAIPAAAPVSGLDQESIKNFMALTGRVAKEIKFSSKRNAKGNYEVQQLNATISFEIGLSANGGLGLSIGAVELGPEASYSKSSTQRLVLEVTRM